jgi:hypothetical protein
MRTKLLLKELLFAMLFIALSSCAKKSPSENIVEIIDATESNLFKTESIEEMQQIQFDMLDKITGYLDSEHNGYRYVEGNEEYNKVMSRLERYNIIYCRALSRFNSEFDTNTGDEDKVVKVLAMMKKMENSALTKPKGFAPQDDNQTKLVSEDNGIFPTQDEIEAVNAKLPVLVSEGTLNTKVEYDERTKVQTFYYRFTQEVDENLISKEKINQLKSDMVSALKNSPNNIKRLNSGMAFLYIYYSVDNRKLYEISINSNDL